MLAADSDKMIDGALTGLMMAHLKMSPKDIKQAIIRLDMSVLTPQSINQLIKFAPTDEEVNPSGQVVHFLR